jgi:AraC-like DNA-binding protein
MRKFAIMKAMLFTVMPLFVCLFWTAMLALEMREDGNRRSRVHLFIFFLTAAVLYFGHCVFFNHSTSWMPLTDTLYCTANLAVYPLYYVYICSLTSRQKYYALSWVLLMPAAVLGSVVGLLYFLMSAAETEQFIVQYLYEGQREGLTGLAQMQVFFHDFCKFFFAMLLVPTFVYGRMRLRQYEKLVANFYADTDDKSLVIIHRMLHAFVITAFFSFILNIVGRQLFDESLWLLTIPSLLFSGLLFVVGYVGYRLKFSIQDIERDEQQADAVAPEQPAVRELRQRIEQLMVEEKLFLKPNFKTVDLVKLLNTNRNYIYQAINRDKGVTFTEYVNRMRIDYAIQLMIDHPEKQLSELAEESGFSSSTSFYRNFRQYKGTGPKEYKTKLSQANNAAS